MNIVNNKIYIGKTVRSLNIRRSEHYQAAFSGNSQTHFHRALRKYSKENFEWSIIHKCKTEKELNETEIHLIDKFDTLKNGYNLTLGGDGASSGENNSFYGKHHTEKTKEIIRQKNIGLFAGEKNYFYGKDYSGEKNYFYGKHHTEKTKEIISKSNSNIWLITFPSGEEIIYRSLSKFSKENNLNYSGVKSAVRNKRIYKDGWKFKKVQSSL